MGPIPGSPWIPGGIPIPPLPLPLVPGPGPTLTPWAGPSQHAPSPPPEPIPEPPPPSDAGAGAWWAAASTPTKVAVVLGAGLVIGGLIALAMRAKPKARVKVGPVYLTNRARRCAIPVKGGTFGRCAPPKKYRDKGARRASDYAYPAGYQYPLVFRTRSGKVKPKLTRSHIRAASARFAKYKRRYPPAIRRQIAKRINQAKRRYGVGGQIVKP